MKFRFGTTIGCAILLTGCGGGGGGGSNSTPQAPVTSLAFTVPLASALGQLATKGTVATFNLVGTVGAVGSATKTPVSGSGTFTLSPAVDSVLDGSAVIKSTQLISGNLQVNGAASAVATTSATFYSKAGALRLADESNTNYVKYSSYTIPVNVSAGDVGSAWLATTYMSRGQISPPGTGRIVATYSASKDSPTSLLVAFLIDTYGDDCNLINTSSVPYMFCGTNLPASHVFNTHTSQTVSTYRIDISGVATLVSIHQYLYGTGGAISTDLMYSF